jgi:hypothetical protein
MPARDASVRDTNPALSSFSPLVPSFRKANRVAWQPTSPATDAGCRSVRRRSEATPPLELPHAAPCAPCGMWRPAKQRLNGQPNVLRTDALGTPTRDKVTQSRCSPKRQTHRGGSHSRIPLTERCQARNVRFLAWFPPKPLRGLSQFDRLPHLDLPPGNWSSGTVGTGDPFSGGDRAWPRRGSGQKRSAGSCGECLAPQR